MFTYQERITMRHHVHACAEWIRECANINDEHDREQIILIYWETKEIEKYLPHDLALAAHDVS